MPPDDDLDDLRETVARALDPSLWNEWGFDKTFNVIMRERNRQKADAVLASLGLEPGGLNEIVRKTERKPGGVAPLRPNGMKP